MLTPHQLDYYRPMRFWWLYFLISLMVILPGVYSLATNGLKLGIDFTGGASIVWESSELSSTLLEQVSSELGLTPLEVDRQDNRWTITTGPLDRMAYTEFYSRVAEESSLQELSFDTIGPSLGAELLRKTLLGLALATTLILLYVAYRFQNLRFGISAILAMLHDSLVVLGIFSILGATKGVVVDTLFVTALLTILSFSVHDTIVVYDRIRELRKKHSGLAFTEIVNRAVVETLGRSLNNSMTIIFMLLAMYLMGGDTTKWFIFALLIGTISGTYSSTFTAAPILVVWDRFSTNLKKKKYS